MSEVLSDALKTKRYVESLRALSIEQFASLYNVGRTRVFEEIKAGRLLTYTVGRRRYISIGAAEQWQRRLELEAIKTEL